MPIDSDPITSALKAVLGAGGAADPGTLVNDAFGSALPVAPKPATDVWIVLADITFDSGHQRN